MNVRGIWLPIVIVIGGTAGCQTCQAPPDVSDLDPAASQVPPPTPGPRPQPDVAAGPGPTSAKLEIPMPVGSGDLPTSVDGSTVTAPLLSGATLRLPGVATARNAGERRLPASVKKAQVFQLGDPSRLLMVNQFDRAGKDCSAILDTEWERMQKNKADQNADRLKFRKVGSTEQLRVGGKRLLYGQSHQRGFGRDDNRPMVGMSTMIFCEQTDHVVLMLATRQQKVPAGAKALLMAIASSYAAKGQ